MGETLRKIIHRVLEENQLSIECLESELKIRRGSLRRILSRKRIHNVVIIYSHLFQYAVLTESEFQQRNDSFRIWIDPRYFDLYDKKIGFS